MSKNSFTLRTRRLSKSAAKSAAMVSLKANGNLAPARKRPAKDLTPFNLLAGATALGSLFYAMAPLAQAQPNLPQGGSVAAGNVTIGQSAPDTMNVVQGSNSAIVNWQSFNVGSGHTVNFQQPNASSVILNRVVGNDPSSIFGTIRANGNVMLVNPNGVVFGPGSRVDVGGLVATTANIRDADFMAGHYNFDLASVNPSASIVNAGDISIRDAGLAALVAPTVENSGVINARLGKVSLGGAKTFALDFQGDGLLSFGVDADVDTAPLDQEGGQVASLVSNSGSIIADGGVVAISARAVKDVIDNVVNTQGLIQANSVSASNGRIILSGGDHGTVVAGGSLKATGNDSGETGGSIIATGDKIAVGAHADIDASGHAGGGLVAIGSEGDGEKGRGTGAWSNEVDVAKTASLKADAIDHGNGGNITLLSEKLTDFGGSISARGGAEGGNGGFAEVSSHKNIKLTGSIDLNAPNGDAGTFLLDPDSLKIVAGSGGSQDGNAGDGNIGSGDQNNGQNTVSASVLEGISENADITLEATGLITVDTSLNLKTKAGHSFKLESTGAEGITFTDAANIISTGGGEVFLLAETAGASIRNVPNISTHTHSSKGYVEIKADKDIELAGEIETGGQNVFIKSNNGSIYKKSGSMEDQRIHAYILYLYGKNIGSADNPIPISSSVLELHSSENVYVESKWSINYLDFYRDYSREDGGPTNKTFSFYSADSKQKIFITENGDLTNFENFTSTGGPQLRYYTSGTVKIGKVDVSGGNLILSTDSGSVLSADDNSLLKIGRLSINVGGEGSSIGSSDQPLLTNVESLSAIANGNINIQNSGSDVLDIGGFSSFNGDVTLKTDGDLSAYARLFGETVSIAAKNIGSNKDTIWTQAAHLNLTSSGDIKVSSYTDLTSLTIDGSGHTDDSDRTLAIRAGGLTWSVTDQAGVTTFNNVTDTTGLDFTYKSSGAIQVGTVNVGEGKVNLAAGSGSITSIDENSMLTASELTISDADAVGSDDHPFLTQIKSFSAVSSHFIDDPIYLENTGFLKLSSVQIVNKDLKITSSQDIEVIGDVNVGWGNVSLVSKEGAVRAKASGQKPLISANSLTVSGTAIGAPDNAINTGAKDLRLTSSGNIYVKSTGDLRALTIDGSGHTDDSDRTLAISAEGLTWSVTDQAGATTFENVVDESGLVFNFTDTANRLVIGNVNVNRDLNTSLSSVSLTGLAIGSFDKNSQLAANYLTLNATVGNSFIGSADQALVTNVKLLYARANGNINIQNSGSDALSVGYLTSYNGDLALKTGGDLSVFQTLEGKSVSITAQNIGSDENTVNTYTTRLDLTSSGDINVKSLKDLVSLAIDGSDHADNSDRTLAVIAEGLTWSVADQAGVTTLETVTDTTGLDFTYKSAGAIQVGTVNVGEGKVNLAASSGRITSTDQNALLTAKSLTLESASGVGTSENYLQTSVGEIVGNITSGDVFIHDHASVGLGNETTALSLANGSLTVEAQNGVTINQVLARTEGNNVSVTTQTGDIKVSSLLAGASDFATNDLPVISKVTLKAVNGSVIIDGESQKDLNIMAGQLVLEGKNNVGATDAPLEVNVAGWDATTHIDGSVIAVHNQRDVDFTLGDSIHATGHVSIDISSRGNINWGDFDNDTIDSLHLSSDKTLTLAENVTAGEIYVAGKNDIVTVSGDTPRTLNLTATTGKGIEVHSGSAGGNITINSSTTALTVELTGDSAALVVHNTGALASMSLSAHNDVTLDNDGDVSGGPIRTYGSGHTARVTAKTGDITVGDIDTGSEGTIELVSTLGSIKLSEKQPDLIAKTLLLTSAKNIGSEDRYFHAGVQTQSATVTGTGNIYMSYDPDSTTGILKASDGDVFVSGLGDLSVDLSKIDLSDGHKFVGSAGSNALKAQGSYDNQNKDVDFDLTGNSVDVGEIKTAGVLTVKGDATLSGNLSTGGIDIKGNATVGGADLGYNTVNGGNINISGDIDSNNDETGFDLTMNAGSGNISIGGSVKNSISDLSLTGANISLGNATTSGKQLYTGATTLDGDYVAGGDFTVTGATVLAENTTVNTASGNSNVTFDGTIDSSEAGSRSLSVNSGSGSMNFKDALGKTNLLQSVTLTSSADSENPELGGDIAFAAVANVSVVGDFQQLGGRNIDLPASIESATGNIDISGAARLKAGASSIKALNDKEGGQVRFQSTITGSATQLTVEAGQKIAFEGAYRDEGDGASVALKAPKIVVNAVTTKAAQSYTGTTTLNGDLAAGSILVDGDTVLGRDGGPSDPVTTTLDTSAANGTITLKGTLDGGRGNVVMKAGGGDVAIEGAVSNSNSLTITGDTIALHDVTTDKNQSYNGATTLDGDYVAGGDFTVTGATVLAENTTVDTTSHNGNVTFDGTIDSSGEGARSLSVNSGSGRMDFKDALGETNQLQSVTLTSSADSEDPELTGDIAFAAVANVSVVGDFQQLGGRNIDLPASIESTNGNIDISGAARLKAGASSIKALNDKEGGQVRFQSTITGSATQLTVEAGQKIAFDGAYRDEGDGASVALKAPKIVVNAVTTKAAQSYTGTTTLNGDLAAGSILVDGDTVLGRDGGLSDPVTTTLDTSAANGTITLKGTLDGGRGNVVMKAGGGDVAIEGAVSNSNSLTITGDTIALHDVTTDKNQSYNGATTLDGDYVAGGDFTVTGATVLAENTTVDTTSHNGNVTFDGTIDSSGEGARSLSVNSGSGRMDFKDALGETNQLQSVTLTSSADAEDSELTGDIAFATTANVSVVGDFQQLGGRNIDLPASIESTNGNIDISGAARLKAGASSIKALNDKEGGQVRFQSTITGSATQLTVEAGQKIAFEGAYRDEGDGASVALKAPKIVVNAVTTKAAQSYTGTTTLNGDLAAGSILVDGDTVLGRDGGSSDPVTTTLDTSAANGTITLKGTLDGGRGDVVMKAGGGDVAIEGAVSNSNSLTITGDTIALHDVTTDKNQSYNGATTLDGDYVAGGDFTVTGATVLAENTTVDTTSHNGNVTFDGTIDSSGEGARSLSVNSGSGRMDFKDALGGTNQLQSVTLTSSADSEDAELTGDIAFAAVANVSVVGDFQQLGGRNIDLPASIESATGNIDISGAARLKAGASSIKALNEGEGGQVHFQSTITGSATQLTVDAGRKIAFEGAYRDEGDGASVALKAPKIVVNAVTTKAAQSYTGTTTLNGDLAAGSILVDGDTVLGRDGGSSDPVTTTLDTSAANGTITLKGTLDGGRGDVVMKAGGGDVAIEGAVSNSNSLTITGDTIALHDVTTDKNQSYNGATTLDGDYVAGGDFTVTGATVLAENTTVDTTSHNGNVTFDGTIDSSEAGSRSLSVNSGSGSMNFKDALGETNQLQSVTLTSSADAEDSELTGDIAFAAVANVSVVGDFQQLGGRNIDLPASIESTNGNIDISGAARLKAGASSIKALNDKEGGQVRFQSTITGSATQLTVEAGQKIAFEGAYRDEGDGASVALKAPQIALHDVTTDKNQSYTGATTLDGTYQSGRDFTVDGDIDVADDTEISTRNGILLLKGAVSSIKHADLTLNTGDAKTVFDESLGDDINTLGKLTINAGENGVTEFARAASISVLDGLVYTGGIELLLPANITSTNGPITLGKLKLVEDTDPLDEIAVKPQSIDGVIATLPSGKVTIRSGDDITIAGLIGTSTDLVMTSGKGDIRIGSKEGTEEQKINVRSLNVAKAGSANLYGKIGGSSGLEASFEIGPLKFAPYFINDAFWRYRELPSSADKTVPMPKPPSTPQVDGLFNLNAPATGVTSDVLAAFASPDVLSVGTAPTGISASQSPGVLNTSNASSGEGQGAGDNSSDIGNSSNDGNQPGVARGQSSDSDLIRTND